MGIKNVMKKYAWVYIRNWDLRGIDKDILSKYGLESLNYWYIGSTDETLEVRNSKWKHQMLKQHKSKTKNNNRYNDNKAKVFINKLFRYYKNEFKLSNDKIESLIFTYHQTQKVDLVKYEIAQDHISTKVDTVYLHNLLESKIINQYYYFRELNRENIILSEKDGGLKYITNKDYFDQKLKNKQISEDKYNFVMNKPNFNPNEQMLIAKYKVNKVVLRPIGNGNGEIEVRLDKIYDYYKNELEEFKKQGVFIETSLESVPEEGM